MATKFKCDVQGTSDMAVFICDVCGHEWIANFICECERCHPDKKDNQTFTVAGR